MELLIGLGGLLVALATLGLAAIHTGTDSRPGPGDDHQRMGYEGAR